MTFLSSAELAATRTKLERINARAKKKGFTGDLTLTAVPATRTERTEGGIEVTVHGFEVEVTGSPAKYEGWSFVATIDDLGDAGVVVRCAPGAPEVDHSTITPGVCDHCHTTRARRHTYLVIHEDGRTMQVGKSCMKDFLGWNTLPVFISEEDAEGSFCRLDQSSDYDLVDFMRVAFAAVEVYGYQNSYAKTPTRDVVDDVLSGHHRNSKVHAEALSGHYLTNEQVVERLDEVRASLAVANTGFEANLRTVLACNFVSRREYGLAASATTVWHRLQTKAAEKAAKEAVPTHDSVHLGTVGEPIEVSGTVIAAQTIDGFHYNTTSRIITVSVGEGDIVKTFTSAKWAYETTKGDHLTIRGTVKAHDEYKGRAETLLARPKVIAVEEEKAA